MLGPHGGTQLKGFPLSDDKPNADARATAHGLIQGDIGTD